MKLLLDECIDRKMARKFVDYEVKTLPQMGWAGVKNGQFLALAEAEFDVFITVDRNLSFQQNLPQFDIAVIVLQAQSNRLADLQPLASEVLAILATVANPGWFVPHICGLTLNSLNYFYSAFNPIKTQARSLCQSERDRNFFPKNSQNVGNIGSCNNYRTNLTHVWTLQNS